MTASPAVRRRPPARRLGTLTVELVGTLGLTDGRGSPRCATVRPPVINWKVPVINWKVA